MDNNFNENFRQNSHWITGEVQDVLIDKDGNRHPLPADHNLVVNTCSNLIAALIKGEESAGVRYWAIGGYLAGENTNGASTLFTSPASTDDKLKKEIYRQEITKDNMTFVAPDNKPTNVITNKLKITVIVPYTAANGTWYEFGLFGGSSASDVENTGIMINRKVHDPIVKSANLQVERNIIFTF